MAKKSKSSFRVEVEDDDDENEWIEEKEPVKEKKVEAAPSSLEPERYDTPEHLAKVAKEKEAKEKKEPAVALNYDLSINAPAAPPPEKKEK